MKEKNCKPNSGLKAILCGSENLSFKTKQLFETVFKTRVYSWYGHTEQGVLAGACEYSDEYHVFPEYGILELINENNKIITSKNSTGEAVTTGLNNFIMPLIRFKTGDILTMESGFCECGREYDLIKNVEGRKNQYIVLKDNSTIPLTSLVGAVRRLEDFPSIIRFQFIQEEPGKVFLKIMGDKNKIERETNHLIHGIYKILGNQLAVDITYVDYISLTKRGKHRRLIQKLKID